MRLQRYVTYEDFAAMRAEFHCDVRRMDNTMARLGTAVVTLAEQQARFLDAATNQLKTSRQPSNSRPHRRSAASRPPESDAEENEEEEEEMPQRARMRRHGKVKLRDFGKPRPQAANSLAVRCSIDSTLVSH